MTRTDKSSNLWLRKRTTCNISKTNYLNVRQKNKVVCKNSVAIDMNDSNDLKKSTGIRKRLQKTEVLARKLKVQLITWASLVIFTIAVYFLLWYSSECWALPFQESPCKKPRALPSILTNHCTLAGLVDEFTCELRSLMLKFNDTIEMPQFDEQKALSNAIKNEIEQLFSLYSSNLVAFGTLRREELRLQYVERGIKIGYAVVVFFPAFYYFFIVILYCAVRNYKHPETDSKILAEEQQDSQKARLKQLKRRVPLLYIAKFMCLAAEVTLLCIFTYGNYRGNSPFFVNVCNYDVIGGNECPFTNYLSFATKLQTNLNERLDKFDTSMGSPNLEVRRLTYEWQSEAITAAIEHHLDLKQYHVDRRTMPREIGNVPLDPILCLVFILVLYIECILLRVSPLTCC
ncbi:hypothetical protein DdX_13233 [Ditylenchus destructor]|uniref:Uncharacterized protein n=1 Tax=Ditylenchus destructor TaxID=166010 RepID=A0AAD4R2X7_9BILA|nr:hypothetical protein DdX_13233 [Ditylenchus destructor]